MEPKLISLALEIKPSAGGSFSFNETMIRAIMSGLSMKYSEIFIWAAKNRLAVWVMGCSNCEVLVNAFAQMKRFMIMKTFTDEQAVHYFHQIINGNEWKDVSPIIKLNALHVGRLIARDHGTLGPVMQLMVADGLVYLRKKECISSARNSYTRSANVKNKKQVIDIVEPDLFYRFCVN